ncbi:hypothetical protein BH11ACT2_BH11ACT2_16030 [soil metagenome]
MKHPEDEFADAETAEVADASDRAPRSSEPDTSDAPGFDPGDVDSTDLDSTDLDSIGDESADDADEDAEPDDDDTLEVVIGIAANGELGTDGELGTHTVEPEETTPASEEPTESEEPAEADEPTESDQLADAPAVPEPATASFDDSTPLARELAEITRRRQALRAQELPLPDKPRVFTIANQKGGVGKTTTTVNLAAALARGGANVLVIDLDPQGNASTALGVEHRAETVSVYDVIINDEPMAAVVQKSPEFDGLFCVPATIHLAGAEIELVSLVAREQRLRTALDRFLAESERQFHYVFIDCPPSLGLLTINAFVAAREVLIPIQCEYYALEGLSQLLSNIQLIERHLNPQLAVSTILLTMYDSRTNLANQVVDEVREHFPKEVLRTVIPRSVRISEAPSYGQTVVSYDPSSPGSLSYLEAAAEMARRGAPS